MKAKRLRQVSLGFLALGLRAFSPSVLAQEAPARAFPEEIVNGVTTSLPASVALLVMEGDPYLSCSGTLIGCRTILTAAHCVCWSLGPGCEPIQQVEVWLQHAGPFTAAGVVVHPDYQFQEAGDLALVTLEAPVDGVSPSAINVFRRPPDGTAGTIVGFGRPGLLEVHGIKRSGRVSTSTSACGVANPDTHVCWDFEEPLGPVGSNSSACYGDSGGPLLAELDGSVVVAGVTSGTGVSPCVPPTYVYDTDVFVHRLWIQQNAGQDLDNTVCGALPQAGAPGAPVVLAVLGPKSDDLVQTHTFQVSPGTTLLRVVLNGQPSANWDLYVGSGLPPSAEGTECVSGDEHALESCEIPNPVAGAWFATALRRSGAGQYQITATTFLLSGLTFADGFESGDTSRWSRRVP